jgi:hypothetical protein
LVIKKNQAMKLISKAIIIMVCLCAFRQTLQSDYEKDLRLVLITEKSGVKKEDAITVSIKNISNRDHHVMYKEDPTIMGKPATYISFSGYMKDKSGVWIKLKEKYQKIIYPGFDIKMYPIRIGSGKTVNMFDCGIYPKKWFEITSPGTLKLVAHYNYKQLTSKESKDTLALKIPTFNLSSDTVLLDVK